MGSGGISARPFPLSYLSSSSPRSVRPSPSSLKRGVLLFLRLPMLSLAFRGMLSSASARLLKSPGRLLKSTVPGRRRLAPRRRRNQTTAPMMPNTTTRTRAAEPAL